MQKISIGRGELTTSCLALGCMRLARVSESESDTLLHTALDCGIDFFDHADIYDGGSAESRFGSFLRQNPSIRDQIFIQSKCSLIPGKEYLLASDCSKRHILSSVESSLIRLNTDHLDSLLLHMPDPLVEPEEVAEAFDFLQRTGKVRFFGVSNHKPMFIELLQKYLSQRLIIDQVQFSVANPIIVDSTATFHMRDQYRADRNGDILTYSRLHNMTIQAWSPFQMGLYGGIYLGSEQYPQLNLVTNRLADEKCVSPSAIAIAWILRLPSHIQPLIGTTNATRLRDICTASEVHITRSEWYEMYRASLADQDKLLPSGKGAKMK